MNIHFNIEILNSHLLRMSRQYMFLMILSLALLFNKSHTLKNDKTVIIKDNFRLCNPNVEPHQFVALDNCLATENNAKDFRTDTFGSDIVFDTFWHDFKSSKARLIARNTHQVYGIGYECTKKIHQYLTYKSIFGAESMEKESELVIFLTKDECKTMVESKRCEKYNMDCEVSTNNDELTHTHCEYKSKTMLSYAWMRTLRFEQVSCEFRKKLIYAKHSSDLLFDGRCNASDLYCKLTDSIITWDKDIIDECPFSHVVDIDVRRENEQGKPYPKNIIMERYSMGAYEIVGVIQECKKIPMYTTSSGLYILKDLNLELSHHKHESEIHLLNALQIAEQDGNRIRQFFYDYELRLNLECQVKTNALKIIAATQDDKFFVMRDNKGKNEAVFYTNNGLVFLPSCVLIDSIQISPSSEQECINQFEASIKDPVSNQMVKVIVDDDNILRYAPKSSMLKKF